MRQLALLSFALLVISLSNLAAADPVGDLRAENLELRQALAFATMQQAQELAQYAHTYAQEHKAFPQKPSDLRSVVEEVGLHPSRVFLAPYDAVKDPVDWPDDQERLWKLIDEHSSYVFHGGELDYDGEKLLVTEKNPIWKGHNASVFQDGHGELREAQGEAP